MKYGVYIEIPYEACMMKFGTLKEARAEVRRWTNRSVSRKKNKAEVTLVKIMSTHQEGDLL